MFYIIGLGLGDYKDVTVKGLEIIKMCDRVYLEAYTSILTCGKEALESFYGRELIVADRDLVEQGADSILNSADQQNVALLVVGDPFGATTHTDLVLRAKEKGIKVQVVHNASILNAVGCCGLQLYSFGETVSIPFWTEGWKPDSFYDKILNNYRNKMHTLCLLDIKVKEPTIESMTKKKKEYMPPKFMSVSEAAHQLLEIVENRKKSGEESLEVDKKSLCVGLARVGHEDQKIIACSLEEMAEVDLGPPLHSMIVVGPIVHPLEEEFLEQFKIKQITIMQVATTINKPDGIIVKRVSVPVGLEEIMQGLTKEVLRKKPKDLYKFAAEYFERLLALRQEKELKETVHTVQSAIRVEGIKPKPLEKVTPRRQPRQVSRQISVRKEDVPLISENKDRTRRITPNRQSNATTRNSVSQTRNRDSSVDSNRKAKAISSNKTTKISSNQSSPRDKPETSTAHKRSSSRESIKSKSNEKSLKPNIPKVTGGNKSQNSTNESTKMVAIVEGIEQKDKFEDRIKTKQINNLKEETREAICKDIEFIQEKSEDELNAVKNTEVTESFKNIDKEIVLKGSDQPKETTANEESVDEVDKTNEAFTDTNITKTNLESVKEFTGESSNSRVLSIDRGAQKESLDMVQKSNTDQEVENVGNKHLVKEDIDDKNINSVQAFLELPETPKITEDLKNYADSTVSDNLVPVAALEEYVGKSSAIQIKSIVPNETNVANTSLSKSETESKGLKTEVKLLEKEGEIAKIDKHTESQIPDSQKQLIKHSKNDVESVKSPPDKIEENARDKIVEEAQMLNFLNMEKKDDLETTEFLLPKIGKDVVDDLIKENEKLNNEIHHELEKIKNDIDHNKEELKATFDKQTLPNAEIHKEIQNDKEDSINKAIKNVVEDQTSVSSLAHEKENLDLKKNEAESNKNVLPTDVTQRIGNIVKSDITKFIQNEHFNVFKDIKPQNQESRAAQITQVVEAQSVKPVTANSAGIKTLVNAEINKEPEIDSDVLIKTEKQDTQMGKESETDDNIQDVNAKSVKPVTAKSASNELMFNAQIIRGSEDTQIGKESKEAHETQGVEDESAQAVTSNSAGNKTLVDSQNDEDLEAVNLSQIVKAQSVKPVTDKSTGNKTMINAQIDNESEIDNNRLINTEKQDAHIGKDLTANSAGNDIMVNADISRESEAGNDVSVKIEKRDTHIDKELETGNGGEVLSVKPASASSSSNETLVNTQTNKESEAAEDILIKNKKQDAQIGNELKTDYKTKVVETNINDKESKPVDNVSIKTEKQDAQIEEAQSAKTAFFNSVHKETRVESDTADDVSIKTDKKDTQIDHKSKADNKIQVIEAQSVKPVIFNSACNETEPDTADDILIRTKKQDTPIGNKVEAGNKNQIVEGQSVKPVIFNSVYNGPGVEPDTANDVSIKTKKQDTPIGNNSEAGNKIQVVEAQPVKPVIFDSARNETRIDAQIDQEPKPTEDVLIKTENQDIQINNISETGNKIQLVEGQSVEPVAFNSVHNDTGVEPDTADDVLIKTEKQDTQIGNKSEAGNKIQIVEVQSVKPVIFHSAHDETRVDAQIDQESKSTEDVSIKTKNQDIQIGNKSEAGNKIEVVEGHSVKPVTLSSAYHQTRLDAQIDQESKPTKDVSIKTNNQGTQNGNKLEADNQLEVDESQSDKHIIFNAADNNEIDKESEAGHDALIKTEKQDGEESTAEFKTQIDEISSNFTINGIVVNDQIGKESEAEKDDSLKTKTEDTLLDKESDDNKTKIVEIQSVKSVISNSAGTKTVVHTQIGKESEAGSETQEVQSGEPVTSNSTDNKGMVNIQTDNNITIKTKNPDSDIQKESYADNETKGVEAQTVKPVCSNSTNNESGIKETKKQDFQIGKESEVNSFITEEVETQSVKPITSHLAGNDTMIQSNSVNSQSSAISSITISDRNLVLVPHIAKESIQKFISSEQTHTFRKTVEEDTIDPKISYIVGEKKEGQGNKISSPAKYECINENKQVDESNMSNTTEAIKIENNTKEEHDSESATSTANLNIVEKVNNEPDVTTKFLEHEQQKALECTNLNKSNEDKTNSTVSKLSNLPTNESTDKFVFLEKKVSSENMTEGAYVPLKEYQEDKIIQGLKENNKQQSLNKENISSFILNEQKHALPNDKLSLTKELVMDKGIYIPLKDYDDEKIKSKVNDSNSKDVIIAKTLLSSIDNLNVNSSGLETKCNLDNSSSRTDMGNLTPDDRHTDNKISSTNSSQPTDENCKTKSKSANKQTSKNMINDNKGNITDNFDINKVDDKLVTKIQALWRGYKFRKDAKKAKDQLQDRVSNNFLEEKTNTSLDVSDAVINGIIKMQAEVRGYLERKQFNRRKRELNAVKYVGADESIPVNNKDNNDVESEKYSKDNLHEKKILESELLVGYLDKKEIETLYSEPMLDEKFNGNNYEVGDSEKGEVHLTETKNVIPETLLKNDKEYEVANGKEPKINSTETSNLEPEKRMEIEKHLENIPQENKNLLRSDTLYTDHTLSPLNNDNIETMISKLDPSKFGRSFSVADNLSCEDNTGRTIVVSELPKDDNNNCQNEVDIKTQIKSAIENISNTLHNMEKIKNEIISSKEFIELKNKSNLQENKDNLDQAKYENGEPFDVKGVSKIKADINKKRPLEETNKLKTVKPINIEAEKARLDALKGHVDLIDQVQNKILDQIAGKNTENAGKFDIDQLKRELEEAAALYNDIDEFSDIPFPMDHNDELLQYLSAFDMEPAGKFDLMVKKPRPIGLPDIKEEDGESKSDSTSNGVIVLERSTKDDDFNEGKAKKEYDKEKQILEKEFSELDTDVIDLHSIISSSPMHIEIKPKSTARDLDHNKENINNLNISEDSDNSSSKMTETAKTVTRSLTGPELANNNRLLADLSINDSDNVIKKENPNIISKDGNIKSTSEPLNSLEKSFDNKNRTKTEFHKIGVSSENITDLEYNKNITNDAEAKVSNSEFDLTKQGCFSKKDNTSNLSDENSNITLSNKTDKDKYASLNDTELTADKAESRQSQSESLDTLVSEDSEDPFSLEKQSTIIERKPELTKIPKVMSKTISGSPRTLDRSESTPRSAKSLTKSKRSISSDSKIPKKEPYTRKTSAGNLINSAADKKVSTKILNKKSSSFDDEQSNTRLSRKGSAKNLGKIGKQKTIQETFKSKEIYDTKQKLTEQSSKEDSPRDKIRKSSPIKNNLSKEKKSLQNVSQKTENDKSMSKEKKNLRSKSNEKDKGKENLSNLKKDLQNKSKESEKAVDNTVVSGLKRASPADISELQRQPTVILANKHSEEDSENLAEQKKEAPKQNLDTEQVLQNENTDSLNNSEQNNGNYKLVKSDSNEKKAFQNRSKQDIENDDRNIVKDIKSIKYSPELEEVGSLKDTTSDSKTTFEANNKENKKVFKLKLDKELSSDSLEVNNLVIDSAPIVTDELHDSLEDKSLEKISPNSLHDSLEEKLGNVSNEHDLETVKNENLLDKISKNIQVARYNMCSQANKEKINISEEEPEGKKDNMENQTNEPKIKEVVITSADKIVSENQNNKNDTENAAEKLKNSEVENKKESLTNSQNISEAENISQNDNTYTKSRNSNGLEPENIKSEEHLTTSLQNVYNDPKLHKNTTSFPLSLDRDKNENSLEKKSNEELALKENRLNISRDHNNIEQEQNKDVSDSLVESMKKNSQPEAEHVNQLHSDQVGSPGTVQDLKSEESMASSVQNVNNDPESNENETYKHSLDESKKEDWLEKKTNKELDLKENHLNIRQVNDNIDHEQNKGIYDSHIESVKKDSQPAAEQGTQLHSDPVGSHEIVQNFKSEESMTSSIQNVNIDPELQKNITTCNLSSPDEDQKENSLDKKTSKELDLKENHLSMRQVNNNIDHEQNKGIFDSHIESVKKDGQPAAEQVTQNHSDPVGSHEIVQNFKSEESMTTSIQNVNNHPELQKNKTTFNHSSPEEHQKENSLEKKTTKEFDLKENHLSMRQVNNNIDHEQNKSIFDSHIESVKKDSQPAAEQGTQLHSDPVGSHEIVQNFKSEESMTTSNQNVNNHPELQKNKTTFNLSSPDEDHKENSLEKKTTNELDLKENRLSMRQVNNNIDHEQNKGIFDSHIESVKKDSQPAAEQGTQLHIDPVGSHEIVQHLKSEESITTSIQNVNNHPELQKNKTTFNHSSPEKDQKENSLEKKTIKELDLKENQSYISKVNDNNYEQKENQANISKVNDNDYEHKNHVSEGSVESIEKVSQVEAEQVNQLHSSSHETVQGITEMGSESISSQPEGQTSFIFEETSETQDSQKPSTQSKLTRGSRSLDSGLTGNEQATSREAPAGDAAVTSSQIASNRCVANTDVTTKLAAPKLDATRTHRLQSARAQKFKASQRGARASSASAQFALDLKAASGAATQAAKCRVVFAPQENCGNSDISRRSWETFGSMASGENPNAEKKNNNILDHSNNVEPQNMEAQAATKIQAGFRGYQVRRQLKLKHESDKKQPKKNSLKAKPEELEEKSAVKIQANVRGFLVRRRQKKQNNSTASA